MIRPLNPVVFCLLLLTVVGTMQTAHSQEPKPLLPLGSRTPQFPLKTKRMIYSDADIAQARGNIAKYPSAKSAAQDVIKKADRWASWSDQALRDIVASADVPRDWWVNEHGCPEHGKEIFQKGGTYPWIVDPKTPFKVKCPIGGELYPSNDYETYYKSGFKTKIGWDTKYVDDGWGWVAPDGKRYWFVAYANHWTLFEFGEGGLRVGQAVRNLGRAYLLTGDKKYAHKAAVLLHRIAEVYPAMNYNDQSRFGQLMQARGSSYHGKLTYHTWEAFMVEWLSEAYDNIWETIDGDAELQKSTGKTGEQIRAYIEANFLEDAIDAYYAKKIAGNFGMHQNALLITALARQNGDNARYLQTVLNTNEVNGAYFQLGLNYALYNLVFRDGTPYESPGYNFLWVQKIGSLAHLLRKFDTDLYKLPRLKLLTDSPLDIINIGRHTPSLGDSGSVHGGIVGGDVAVYQRAYRAYGDPRYAQFLAYLGATGDGGYKGFESLFNPPIENTSAPDNKRAVAPQPSRLLSGYGFGILNNAPDTHAAALYYGFHGSHYHHDWLNLDIFGYERPLMPDLGYPDAMNEFVEGIYTWSNNTISHNTVTVDASKQSARVAGTLHLFADGPFARVLDADANGVYTQAETYRRSVVMVDVDAERSYYVDMFNVVGGRQHDYSLHGPTGNYESLNGQWSAPAPGTLAGENVPRAQIYDDPKLGAPDYKGGFYNYRGSGFQHLFNVQTHQGGEVLGQYAHEKDPTTQLRIRILPQQGQQVLAADARVSPVKYPEIVKYLIARRVAGAGETKLSSRFVSVLEPYKSKPFISSVEPIATPSGAAVLVRREGGTDLILQDNTSATKTLQALSARVETDAGAAVVSFDTAGAVSRVFFAGGTFLSVGGKRYQSPPVPQGRVTQVDTARRTVRVRFKARPTTLAPQQLVGRVVHFYNSHRKTAHTVTAATLNNNDLTLTTKDDLLIGLVKLAEFGEKHITTTTDLPLEPTYAGATLSDRNFQNQYPVLKIAKGKIELAAPLTPNHPLKKGDDAWLVDVGPQDTLMIPALFTWQR